MQKCRCETVEYKCVGGEAQPLLRGAQTLHTRYANFDVRTYPEAQALHHWQWPHRVITLFPRLDITSLSRGRSFVRLGSFASQ